MKRTQLVAYAVTIFACLASSIAVGTSFVFSRRSQGLTGALTIVVACLAGGCFGYYLGVRRKRKHQLRRLTIRRGAWLIVIPSLVGSLVGSLIATPSVFVWLIAALAGLGLTTAITATDRIAGKPVLALGGTGLLLGLVAVGVISQANLRETVNQVAQANGVTVQQRNLLPKSISLTQAASLARDPRIGVVAGSLREARQQTIASQFSRSLRIAAILGFLSLLTSLFLPRRLRPSQDSS
jgi:hypothetical protein